MWHNCVVGYKNGHDDGDGDGNSDDYNLDKNCVIFLE